MHIPLQRSHRQVHFCFIFASFSPSLPVSFDCFLPFLLIFLTGTIVNSHAGIVTPFAGSGQPGSSDGLGSSASFNYPYGIAIDQQTGNLFVSDQNNHLIRKITPQGMCAYTLLCSTQTILTITKRRGLNNCWVATRLCRWKR